MTWEKTEVFTLGRQPIIKPYWLMGHGGMIKIEVDWDISQCSYWRAGAGMLDMNIWRNWSFPKNVVGVFHNRAEDSTNLDHRRKPPRTRFMNRGILSELFMERNSFRRHAFSLVWEIWGFAPGHSRPTMLLLFFLFFCWSSQLPPHHATCGSRCQSGQW